MGISRRAFLKYCSASAAVLGLDPLDLGLLRKALANPASPVVVWLHGSSCTGCSVSLLNRINQSGGQPEETIVDVLTGAINLVYHGTIMGLAGEGAGAALKQAHEQGSYILVTEGGVPMAFNGRCCVAYSFNGREVTYQEAVAEMASRAAHIVCVGTCASFGGIPRSGGNPTGIVSVGELIGRQTINISGCPANPEWVVWAVVQLLLGNPVSLDEDSRPIDLYARDLQNNPCPPTIHEKCPRNGHPFAESFSDTQGKCMVQLGCRGPLTKARCEACWNGIPGRGNWCIGINAPCHGCTKRTFPGPDPFYKQTVQL
jgi:hydrogenase small subunit